MLGLTLKRVRESKGWSMREVEARTKNLSKAKHLMPVSNAYLTHLEAGRIKSPNPRALCSLSIVYTYPYDTLMREAGYHMPYLETTLRKADL